MELKGRPVRYFFNQGMPKVDGTFLFYGQTYDYPDGRNPVVVSKVYIERDSDGQISCVDPENVRFLDKNPGPLAEGPGHATTQP